jgi:hypothetical protein
VGRGDGGDKPGFLVDTGVDFGVDNDRSIG